MPQAGQIISWPKYRFPEGNIRDKLFVVLNESLKDSDPCLLLLTTHFLLLTSCNEHTFVIQLRFLGVTNQYGSW